jgi:hypothetical protein
MSPWEIPFLFFPWRCSVSALQPPLCRPSLPHPAARIPRVTTPQLLLWRLISFPTGGRSVQFRFPLPFLSHRRHFALPPILNSTGPSLSLPSTAQAAAAGAGAARAGGSAERGSARGCGPRERRVRAAGAQGAADPGRRPRGLAAAGAGGALVERAAAQAGEQQAPERLAGMQVRVARASGGRAGAVRYGRRCERGCGRRP